MKKYILITLFMTLLAGIFPSCNEDNLTEVPKTFFAPENLYRSTGGFEVALNAVYDQIRGELTGETKPPAMFTGTDVHWSVFSHPFVKGFEEYGSTLTANLSVFQRWWDGAYQGLAWVNLILREAENEEVRWDNPVDRERIIAEARFFRAYFHNQITTMFGDVPILDRFYEEPKLDFVRSSKTTVLEFVRQDLEYAAENLPSDPASLPRGKVSKWAAKHLLAEVYIHLGEYALAETTANDVINSGPHKLMTSRFGPEADDPKGNVFRDLFLEGNVDFKDGNLESIWAMQNEWDADGGNGDNWLRRQHVAFYQRGPGMQIADSLGGRGIGRIAPTQAYLDMYEENDTRNTNNNLRRKWYYNNPATLPEGKNIGDLVVLDPNDPLYEQYRDIDLYPSTTKWDFGVQGRGSSATYLAAVKDYHKMRLGETYLLLAEAQHLKGDNNAAANTLNILRARSNASSITAGEVDMNFILDERARELYSEEYRRQTLFRTGMFLERVKAQNLQVADKVTERDELWPIPQSVIDANVEATFAQNPGYN
ncbi:RagB/SusD family nutrient uptake outer membrane protein [Sunxiuqinia rutila]|uniref:RagB/SusD family nutrient uptake outer membrane protein n=1 Tax=Sunxiuqinia rutila TaxID=1397841 RepID=UPI003D367B18